MADQNPTYKIRLSNGYSLLASDVYLHDGCLSVWTDGRRLVCPPNHPDDAARYVEPDQVLSAVAWEWFKRV